MGTPGLLVVKRYRLLRALGQGGMGVVWEGHDELLDRPVAVKEIVPPPTLWPPRAEAEFFARVALSATGATRVSHPHLVAIYDVAEDDDGRLWIVMEPFQARSLDRVIGNDGPLTAPRAAEIGRPLLDALAAAHAAGVVHGDVKPANVLIGYDGRVALSDLGVAPEGGTPGFAAPEGAGTGPAADLWSLGATLFAAMVGAPPSPEPTIEQMPGPLRPVLWGLLAPDPANRLTAPEATRLLAELLPAPERASGGKPARKPAGGPSARTGDAPARHRAPVLVAAAAVLVLAGGVGGWALLRSPGDGAAGGVAGPPATARQATTAPAGTGVPSAASTPTPTPARLALKWYRPGTGWKAAYPKGWTRTGTDDGQEWAAPDGAAHFAVQVIDWGGEDPMFTVTRAEREVSEAAKAYRKIRLERIEFPGARAAEWEGRWKAADESIHPWAEKGVIYHELRRVIFTGRTTTILTWVTTDTAWARLKPTLAAVFDHYRVPKGDLLPAPPSPSPTPS